MKDAIKRSSSPASSCIPVDLNGDFSSQPARLAVDRGTKRPSFASRKDGTRSRRLYWPTGRAFTIDDQRAGFIFLAAIRHAPVSSLPGRRLLQPRSSVFFRIVSACVLFRHHGPCDVVFGSIKLDINMPAIGATEWGAERRRPFLLFLPLFILPLLPLLLLLLLLLLLPGDLDSDHRSYLRISLKLLS